MSKQNDISNSRIISKNRDIMQKIDSYIAQARMKHALGMPVASSAMFLSRGSIKDDEPLL